MMSLYVEFFNFPTLQFQMSVSSVALALALTLTASIVAALGAVRRAFSVPPAEGMRGEPPPSFKRGVFDQLDITTIAPPLVRVLLRNLERRPARALLSIFGIALAVMILISGRFAFDSLDQIVAIYFRSSQREDVTVAFREPVAATVARELSRLPDVREVELSRVVPVRITAQQRSRRVALIGLEDRGELRRLVNGNGNVVSLTPAGLLLTRKLAEVLEVEPGQHVRLELLEGRRRTLMLPVTRVVDELIGTAAYMDRRTVNRLMREGDLASMAHIATTSPEPSILGRKLKRLPGVTEVAFRKSMLRSFEETLAENLHIQVAFLIAFASIISFGIVYNSARIALSERGYELSSLRVLGFTRREAALLLLGEQALLTIAAIPLGVAFGWGIAWWISSLFDSEVYRLPLVISGYTYGFALLIIGVSAFVSGVAVRLKIGRLVLVEALKTRE